jgi:acyl carrier protein
MNATIFCEPASPTADVFDRLRSCLPARLRGISPETPIASLELDSLDRVEFLCALDAEFHVSLTLEEFESITTPAELAALIHRKTNNPF